MCNKSLFFLSFLFFIPSLLMAAAVQPGGNFGDITDEEWRAAAPADYPEANAVILFDHGAMYITLERVEYYFHRRLKILNKAGIDEASEQAIYFDKEFDHLSNFAAQTITPDGKKHKVDKKAIFDQESDSYIKRVFTFPALDTGCIIEYKYRLRSERFYYLEPWYFQNRFYTYQSLFSVSMVSGFSYDVNYNRLSYDQQRPEIEDRTDPHRPFGSERRIKDFTWDLKNLPPVKKELYMACEDDYRMSLQFFLNSFRSQYNSFDYTQTWGEVGKDFQKYIDDHNDRKKEIKKLAEEITAGMSDPRKKSKALYDYVATGFEAIDKSRWRFKIDKFSKFLEEKRGTGEGKNCLLACLHNSIGLNAWPVLISTRDRAKFKPNRPSLIYFNYIVTFVQLDSVWEFLDAAYEHTPYGLLPPNCLTEGGFLIDGENSELVRITIKPLASIRTDINRIFISSDGAAACSTCCKFTGYYGAAYGERYDQNTPDDFIEDNFADRLEFPCTINDYNCDLDSSGDFNVNLNYTVENLAEKLDNNYLITPVNFAFRENPFVSEKRFFPVDFAYKFTYKNITRLFCDGDHSECRLPDNITYQLVGATFIRQSEVTDSCIIVAMQLDITKPQFSPVEYGRMREFFERVALAGKDQITVIMNEPAEPATDL